jgi:hypothetical protein
MFYKAPIVGRGYGRLACEPLSPTVKPSRAHRPIPMAGRRQGQILCAQLPVAPPTPFTEPHQKIEMGDVVEEGSLGDTIWSWHVQYS